MESYVLVFKGYEPVMIKSPQVIRFKPFAYDVLEVQTIEVVYLSDNIALLIDEEGIFNGWKYRWQLVHKASQKAINITGNFMVVDVSDSEDFQAPTNEQVAKFLKDYSIYPTEN